MMLTQSFGVKIYHFLFTSNVLFKTTQHTGSCTTSFFMMATEASQNDTKMQFISSGTK